MIRIKKDRCGYTGYTCDPGSVELTAVFADTEQVCDELPSRTTFATATEAGYIDNYLDLPDNIAGFTMVEKDVPDLSGLSWLYSRPAACYSSLDVVDASGLRGGGAFLDLFNTYRNYNELGMVRYRVADAADLSTVYDSAFFNRALLCYHQSNHIFTPSLLEPVVPHVPTEPIGISTVPIYEQIIPPYPEPEPYPPYPDIEDIIPIIITRLPDVFPILTMDINVLIDIIVRQVFEQFPDFNELIRRYIEIEFRNEIIQLIDDSQTWLTTYIDTKIQELETRLTTYINTQIQYFINNQLTNLVTNIVNTQISEVVTNVTNLQMQMNAINTSISNINTSITNINTKIENIKTDVDISQITRAVLDSLPTTPCPPR